MCENPQLLCIVLPALRTGEALWVVRAGTSDQYVIGSNPTRRARYILTIHIEYQSMSMFLLVEGCLGHFYIFF